MGISQKLLFRSFDRRTFVVTLMVRGQTIWQSMAVVLTFVVTLIVSGQTLWQSMAVPGPGCGP